MRKENVKSRIIIALGLAGMVSLLMLAVAQELVPDKPGVGRAKPENIAAAEKALTRPEPVRLLPELLKEAKSGQVKIKISLSSKRLLVLHADKAILDSPIACGRHSSPTPAGEFKILSKEESSKTTSYGSLVTERGNVLVRKGVYAKLDAVPFGQKFVPAPPNFLFRLNETGLAIHSGDANGTASTDGSIVIPTKIARTLHKIGDGAKVMIEE